MPSSAWKKNFFNDTATTEIYTLSLHDALPISSHALQDSQSKVNPNLRLGLPKVYKYANEYQTLAKGT